MSRRRRPRWKVLIASHISAEKTSRTRRAPSRAPLTQNSTEAGSSGSSVSSEITSSRPEACSRSAPMIASSASHDRRVEPASVAGPCRSAWKTPSSSRAVCSARERLRPTQYSSCAILASIRLLLLLLLLVGPGARAQVRHARARPARRRGRPVGVAVAVVLEHPGVLRAAALRGVDDHRALAQRDARQAAGHDVDVLAEDGERAQVDVARRERAVGRGGRAGRELHELLCDPALGLAAHDVGLPGELLLAGGRADEHALAARLARRLDHHLLEPLEHVAALVGV